jgi:hypothetical protein
MVLSTSVRAPGAPLFAAGRLDSRRAEEGASRWRLMPVGGLAAVLPVIAALIVGVTDASAAVENRCIPASKLTSGWCGDGARPPMICCGGHLSRDASDTPSSSRSRSRRCAG